MKDVKARDGQSARFAGNARLTVRWSGASWWYLQDVLAKALRAFGLRCLNTGYDKTTNESTMIFQPTAELRVLGKWLRARRVLLTPGELGRIGES